MRGRNAEDGWKRGEWRGARPQPWVPPPHAPRALLEGLRTCVRGSPRRAGRSRLRARPAPTSSPAHRSRGTEAAERRTSRLTCSRFPRRPAAERRLGVARAGFSCRRRGGMRNYRRAPEVHHSSRARVETLGSVVANPSRVLRREILATPRSRARRARGSARSRVATPVVPPSEKAHAGFDPSPARCRSNVERSLSRDTVDREPAISIGACLTGVDRRNCPARRSRPKILTITRRICADSAEDHLPEKGPAARRVT